MPQDAKVLKNATPEQTLQLALEQADEELAAATQAHKRIVAQILELTEAEIQRELKAKDEPFGTVHANGFTFNVPKKITWDEVKLRDLAAQIAKDGEKPEEYIDISYAVSESKFKAWPEAIKNAFIPARTVQQGNVAVKLKKGE